MLARACWLVNDPSQYLSNRNEIRMQFPENQTINDTLTIMGQGALSNMTITIALSVFITSSILIALLFTIQKLLLTKAISKTLTPHNEQISRALESWRIELTSLIRTESTSSNTQLRQEFDSLLHRLYEHQSLYQQRDDSAIQRQIQFHQEMGVHIEKIRLMVEEQLHTNLEQKLAVSFGNVADRLAKVHESLGEVSNLSRNMSDVQKLLTNVKTRGIWGEVQLESLLEQMLAPNQYQKNFKPVPHGTDLVEFAIRLPGHNEEVWLPVDAKFPTEYFMKIQEASENGSKEELLASQKLLEQQIRTFAKDVSRKYISPPRTTDFAVIFLPSESLFAEVVRTNGLLERLQTEFRVTITGPTTFCALLCSLQMGFRSLQIQERTADVWKILQEVRQEFHKFASTVEAVQKKLAQAHDQMDDVGRRSRVLEKRLTTLGELENIHEDERLTQELEPKKSNLAV